MGNETLVFMECHIMFTGRRHYNAFNCPNQHHLQLKLKHLQNAVCQSFLDKLLNCTVSSRIL